MKDSIDRLPPHSTEAESAFIGCLMLNPVQGVSESVALGVNANWFYDIRHQEIFTTITGMVDNLELCDIVTIHQKLKDSGKIDRIGGLGFITSILDAAVSAANLPYYAEILKEKSIARDVLRVCTEVAGQALEGKLSPSILLDKAESSILSIRQLQQRKEVPTIRELAIQVTHRIEERLSGKTGLRTGFADIDRRTNGGMQDAEMWVVAARPNAGKTAWVMNVADSVAERYRNTWLESSGANEHYAGEHVVVFSLEMTAEALTERMVSSRARVNTRVSPQTDEMRQQNKAAISELEMSKLGSAVATVSKLPVIIDDTVPMSVADIRARARRYYAKKKARLFIIDYLQLIASELGSKETDRRVQVDGISRGLKSLAKELRVPILVLAQLNRDIEKDGKSRKPRMSDLRESGQIEQDADLIGFLYPDPSQKQDDAKPSDPRTIFFRIGKQRNGPKDFDVPLTFLPTIVRFESQSNRNEESY